MSSFLHLIFSIKYLIRPTLTFEEVKFFFEKFKNGDVNDMSFRTALVDTFINRIYLYDGDDARAEIYCNASDQGMKVPISKLDNSSLMGGLARPMRLERTTYRVGVCHSIQLSYGRVSG